MPWFPDMAISAFCDTVQLLKKIVGKRQLPLTSARQVLEPSSAEFIAALAAGSNSHSILQVGCGLSTIALAAAARATGTCLLSVHTDKQKQEIVRHHVTHLGLIDFVDFIMDEATEAISQREEFDFAVFTGDPKCYIRVFDLLKLKHGAIVIADNALHDCTNQYIKHVRRQPGVESSSLPLGRGIEVTKIINGNDFKSGRILYTELLSDDAENRDTVNGLKSNIPSSSSFKVVSAGSSFQQLDPVHQNMSHSRVGTCHFGYSDTHSCRGRQVDEFLNPSTSEDRQHKPDLEHILDISEVASGDPCRELVSSSEIVLSEETAVIQSIQHQEVREKQFLLVNNSDDQSDPDMISPAIMTSNKFNVHFRNYNSQTEVSVKGMDQDMLLTDITMAFNEMGVSVQRAKISTQGNFIEDVFYVVDGKSRTPLDPGRWDSIRRRILQKISKHMCLECR